jgi:hypothetical protein
MPSDKISITLQPSERAALQLEAKMRGKPLTVLIRDILYDWMQNHSLETVTESDSKGDYQ